MATAHELIQSITLGETPTRLKKFRILIASDIEGNNFYDFDEVSMQILDIEDGTITDRAELDLKPLSRIPAGYEEVYVIWPKHLPRGK